MTNHDDTAKAKLLEEGLYDQETCDEMTATEAEKLWQLHQMAGQAFDAVCDELTLVYEYNKSRLSDAQRADIVEEAESLLEEFDEADVAGRYQNDVTRLLVCQRRCHDLDLEIMNIRDGVVARFFRK